MTLHVRSLEDADEFLAHAGGYLSADEARHNLILGIAGTISTMPDVYPEHRFWIARDEGSVVGAAARTPPWNLIVAQPRDDAALVALERAIDEELPGVVGAVPEVHRFAELWTADRNVDAHTERAEGVYALDDVADVQDAPGRMRAAHEDDRELLVRWIREFSDEVLGETDPGRDETERLVDNRLSSNVSGFVLWEDDDEPVSVSGYGGPTPNGIRIGPVYTPPDLRGRGYATSLVAGLSADLLARGKRFCFLFTDLANPTSNAIYERIGYRRVCDAAHVVFR